MHAPHLPQLAFDRKFYSTAATIAVPIIVQHLISISLNMVDTMMVGKVGIDQLAGVGAANRLYFVFMVICFGFFSGTSVRLAQYWGVKDVLNIRKLMGINYIFALGMSVITISLAYPLAENFIHLFAKDGGPMIGYGVEYLHYVLPAYLFNALTVTISFNSRAIHRLVWPTAINALALALNTGLNYILIFGKLGFDPMGVKGAAIATVIARFIEFALIMLYTYKSKNHPLAGTIKQMLSFDRELLKPVLRTATPALVSETTWSIGNAVYYMAYGIISSSAIAVIQVAGVVTDLFQALFFGLGSACAVMIGNELGRKRKDLALVYAKRFLWLTLGFCTLTMLLFWLLKMPIVNFYDLEGDASPLLAATLNVYILFTIPRMLTYTLFIGILRAGGDTKFCMILDVLGIWCIGVPLAFIGAKWLGWELPYVVALSLIEEVIKLFICLHRMKTRRWVHVLI